LRERGGPQIVLRDAYTGAPLFASDPLNDADFWKEAHSKSDDPGLHHAAGAGYRALPPPAPQFRGKLWLGDFELSPENSPDDSPRRFPTIIPQDNPRTPREFRPWQTQPESAPVARSSQLRLITNNALLSGAGAVLLAGAAGLWRGRGPGPFFALEASATLLLAVLGVPPVDQTVNSTSPTNVLYRPMAAFFCAGAGAVGLWSDGLPSREPTLTCCSTLPTACWRL